eukprot:TRINITY_DN15717_c1_g1_i1.p1 TRINITY_DN15717_c1_g1~~TRINITY_DN15717_c1_g1_i1.p1  ORF type:complete len:739 (+),score=169.03 TRINITY_DN15717_c1_g1_i1:299-2218(+)
MAFGVLCLGLAAMSSQNVQCAVMKTFAKDRVVELADEELAKVSKEKDPHMVFQDAVRELRTLKTEEDVERVKNKMIAASTEHALRHFANNHKNIPIVRQAGERLLEDFKKKKAEGKPIVELPSQFEDRMKEEAKLRQAMPPWPIYSGESRVPKNFRQNVLVRCLLDNGYAVNSVAVMGGTIKAIVDTCKGGGTDTEILKKMHPTLGQKISTWTPEEKGRLACFLNANGLVGAMSYIAEALSFAAGDCSNTIYMPEPTFDQNAAVAARLCAADIATVVAIVSQFATGAAMAGTSCVNLDDQTTDKASRFGNAAAYETTAEAEDDFTLPTNRRLSGSAVPVPQLGGGGPANSMACLLDAETVALSMMQIGVEMDFAINGNCPGATDASKGGNYPTTWQTKLANQLSGVTSASCTGNVGGAMNGFVNVITILQLMVMHCDNIMSAQRMCGQGVSMFFSAATTLVRAGGQLHAYCWVANFTAGQVVGRSQDRYDAYEAQFKDKMHLNPYEAANLIRKGPRPPDGIKGSFARRLKEKELTLAEVEDRAAMAKARLENYLSALNNGLPDMQAVEQFWNKKGFNISDLNADFWKAHRSEGPMKKLMNLIGPGAEESKLLKAEREAREASWVSKLFPRPDPAQCSAK